MEEDAAGWRARARLVMRTRTERETEWETALGLVEQGTEWQVGIEKSVRLTAGYRLQRAAQLSAETAAAFGARDSAAGQRLPGEAAQVASQPELTARVVADHLRALSLGQAARLARGGVMELRSYLATNCKERAQGRRTMDAR